ncbi:MAG: TAXI family TRAP transporter solute-binding subunit [Burkholderiales bacterium]|nr:TAXI family TRAP transporter solute-binding subunit [Burkholderiales bacterium]
MVHLVTRALALALVLFIVACTRGPDGNAVREAIQKQLDDALGGRVLAVERLTRAGGVPLAAGPGRLVYYNAELVLARDYDFTNWDAHSVASLANLLGAGPKGVIGVSPGGNKAGDRLGVYGSAAFAESGNQYTLVPAAPSDAVRPSELPVAASVGSVQPPAREVRPPTEAEAALARLSELFDLRTPRTVPSDEREAILTDEFTQAYARARARIDRASKAIVVAGGPVGGAYAETLRAIDARARATGVLLDTLGSEGSVGNIRLLNVGTAQFAIVQNDIARSAMSGSGRFAGAPQPSIRAVASLFPETVHLVARADRGIAGVGDLRGKRVDLGLEGSGTRANATAILAVSGLGDALASTSASALPDAAAALGDGRIDAFFATIHAPAEEIARLAARTPLTIVPIGPSKELVDGGLVPLTLPPLTYAGQRAPVPTLAATALLVTREDVDAQSVATMMQLLFERREGTATAAVSQIRLDRAREGVNVPMHAQADVYLKSNAATAGKPSVSR